MGTPFAVAVRCEVKNVEPKSTHWAALRIDPIGSALESQRAPLAITLVIDSSGSMQGTPLEHVTKSAELLLDLLDERDRIALVSFNNTAAVVAGLTAVDEAGKPLLRAALRGLTAGGGTNIHAGLSVGAGVLMTAPGTLRRAMVLMSDGQPNDGLTTPPELAAFTRGLGLAVSTLGFGLAHDENVLEAIATAGSGRYAYIPDPILARVELARAALAHGGIVADHLELKLKLADGVELVQLLPASQLRHGGSGVSATLGDIFIDAGRLLAMELALDLPKGASGELAELIVMGRSPDGTAHEVRVKLVVDVRSGAAVVDRDAQRDVITVQAEAARSQARAQADRRAFPAAAAILQAMIKRIEALPGFVLNDGSPLAELREQLQDEVDAYSRTSTDAERGHQRKASMAYRSEQANYARAPQVRAPLAAQLVGMSAAVSGLVYPLMTDTRIGRSKSAEVPVNSERLSREHARILFVTDHFVIQDTGSTNGSSINGSRVLAAHIALRSGDVVAFGGIEFRFEIT